MCRDYEERCGSAAAEALREAAKLKTSSAKRYQQVGEDAEQRAKQARRQLPGSR